VVPSDHLGLREPVMLVGIHMRQVSRPRITDACRLFRTRFRIGRVGRRRIPRRRSPHLRTRPGEPTSGLARMGRVLRWPMSGSKKRALRMKMGVQWRKNPNHLSCNDKHLYLPNNNSSNSSSSSSSRNRNRGPSSRGSHLCRPRSIAHCPSRMNSINCSPLPRLTKSRSRPCLLAIACRPLSFSVCPTIQIFNILPRLIYLSLQAFPSSNIASSIRRSS
jgi:hypothetical protein